MDMKNSLALRKKRELLGSVNKRKMSLRKYIDNIKQNECRLDITQITKCVFLGSLCLKPVPQLFDSPLLLEELDMKVGNVRSIVPINNENIKETQCSSNKKQGVAKESVKKGVKRQCLNSPKVKKKSLRERNESKVISNGVKKLIKNESVSFEQKECVTVSERNQALCTDENEDIIADVEPLIRNSTKIAISISPPVSPDISIINPEPPAEEAVKINFNRIANISSRVSPEIIIINSQSPTNDEITEVQNGTFSRYNSPPVSPDIRIINIKPPTENAVKSNFDRIASISSQVSPEISVTNSQSPRSEEIAEVRNSTISLSPVVSIIKRKQLTSKEQTDIDNDISFEEEIIDLKLLKQNHSGRDAEPCEIQNDISFEKEIVDLKLLTQNSERDVELTNDSIEDNLPPDIKTVVCAGLHYEDVERLKREPTPELILSDSDEDAIDQLMFNIMDIKVGPNVFDEEFFDMPPSDIEESEEEYSKDLNRNSETVKQEDQNESKYKTYIKRHPQCKICSKIFSSYMQLKKHKQAHNGDKPYLCLKCNQNHTTLDQLIAHLRTHQGKRPYVCKKCNKGFKSTRALEKHRPVHVLRKAVVHKKIFKCEVCRKEFRKLCDLERHTRVHTGEKPSVCNICNKRFQQAHNLNKHLLIHTKEKPYECDICNKKFGRNDVLNRHLLTHSVEKPNNCEVCMKSFIRVSQLLAHKEKYHVKKAS